MQEVMSRASQNDGYSRSYPSDKTPEEIFNALQGSSRHYEGYEENNKQGDELSLFREQMRLVDSMQKANMSSVEGARTEKGNNTSGQNTGRSFDTLKDSTFRPLRVSPLKKESSGFNTVRPFTREHHISALIDHAEKVQAGTRVRIRLLQDIAVGDHIVAKGTYVYGFVTGFQSQRVNISINQILLDGAPLPVKLDVFDRDGYLGLYVPKSNFLEFTKELGTQGTSGLSTIQTAERNGLTASLLSKLFTTTGSSLNRAIQKNKAFIKYNYFIYLKERER